MRNSTYIPRPRVVILAMSLLLAALAVYALAPMPSSGQSASNLRARIEAKRAKEQVLTSDIAKYRQKMQRLQSHISRLQSRQQTIEGDLQTKQARQQSIESELISTRARLERLRSRLERGQRKLSARLVESYKSDEPDLLTVALEADGFEELLERTEFMSRIARQDRRILITVGALKLETGGQAKKLASLEAEASRLVAQVAARRDQVASAKGELVARNGELGSVKNARTATLSRVRSSRSKLEGHLAAIEREQGNVLNVLSGDPGPIKKGSGQFIWPINGAFTSPFGTRWGRLHAGVDLAAPNGTPIRAADGGRVAYAGWMGGYGNYTCIQHGGSISTCYAHQSSIGVSVGQTVSKGQVIGGVGNTGNSFGDHLHFEVRVNGSPVDPMGYL